MRPGLWPVVITAAAALAGVLLLAALVWWMGPLVPGLGGWLPRLALCLALLLAWAGGTGWLVWREVSRARALAAGLLDGGRGTEDAALLQDRFAEALALLRKGGGAAALHQQPWYVVIGPPGAGKTTALVNAGLALPLAETGQPQVRGVGGTRNCDWWFTDRAVLIDTAGRYTTQDSDAAADRAGWQSFLGLLLRTRPRQPLNGIIVALSVTEIAGAPPGLRTALARAIRARVAELDERLKRRLPVYMVFTKADLIAGFTEFFDDLDPERRGQVWGTTFPLPARGGVPAPDTADALAGLVARLDSRTIERLQAERSSERRRMIAGFPAQVASLAEPLAAFVAECFGGSRLSPAPLLRGVYLTSGTQDGTPIDRLTSTLARAFGVTARQAPSLRPERGRSYFLHRLLAEVLPGEAMLVSHGPGLVRRQVLLRWGGFAACILATVLGCGAVWQLRAANLGEQAQLAAALDVQARVSAARRLDPVADSDFAAILPLLDQASALPFADRAPTASGQDQGGTLGAISRAVYRRALAQVLFPRLVRRLETQIAGSIGQPDVCYEATRIYLMLGNAGPLDAGQVEGWLRQDWEATYPGPAQAAGRERLASHLRALLAEPLPAVALDGALVERARATFSQASPAARVYGRIRHSAAAEALPPWRPIDSLGPAKTVGAAIFTRQSGRGLDEGVPGLFTADGYASAFMPALGPAIRAVAEESWVLGIATGVADTPTKMAALEADTAALYQAEFFREWDGLLEDLQIVPVRSVSQGAQDLYILASPQSPVRELLTGIVRQATLARDATDGAGTGGARTAWAGQRRPEDAFAAHYRPLQELVRPGSGQPVELALRSLNDVQQYLAKIAQAPVNTPLPAPATGADPVAALQVEAKRWPNPLGRWLTTIAVSVGKLLAR